MKKSKFIKSSIILIIGGMILKAVGLLTKIILTRKIGIDMQGLYSLILPTYLLIISIILDFPIFECDAKIICYF